MVIVCWRDVQMIGVFMIECSVLYSNLCNVYSIVLSQKYFSVVFECYSASHRSRSINT